METMTVKQNGVYIIRPVREKAPIKRSRSFAKPVRTLRKEHDNPYICSSQRHEEKKCVCCGDNVWRSDVEYCWDCYKYQKYESR